MRIAFSCTLLLLLGLGSTPAAALTKEEQACYLGQRVVLEDGRAGVTDSVASIGSCFVKLDDGSLAASQPGSLRREDAKTKKVSSTPQLGVYDCNTPGLGINVGAAFGLISKNKYRNFDGDKGKYDYDEDDGILEFTSGEHEDLRFKRTTPNSFQMLDNNDKLTSTNCTLNTHKDINGRW